MWNSGSGGGNNTAGKGGREGVKLLRLQFSQLDFVGVPLFFVAFSLSL